ncbi:MAG: hypothetical protein JW814_10620 [Candidatus Krumholzibacteriota bacterium]|nr:hypothetical protein [Candidatus Krumholzibacteriota bacterium]
MKVSDYFAARSVRATGVVTFFLFAAGCAAPFSDFQSARTVGRGKAEITGHYCAASVSGEKLQDQLGVQAGMGISDRADLRVRYENINPVGSSIDPIGAFGFGPKWALDPDHVAFYLPVGFAFGEHVESSKTWEVHPTLLTTQKLGSSVEINISLKLLLGLDDQAPDHRVAANVGLGIGPDRTWLLLRPEAGIMFSTGGGDPFYHFGIGISFSGTDKRRSEMIREE